jgi:crossover junction endodeoxyribonuclease RusA
MNILELRTPKLALIVYGQPQPAGSKIPGRAKTGRLFVRDDNPAVKDWQRRIADEAIREMNGRPLLEGPLRLSLRFYLKRPKGHYGTGKNQGSVRASAPGHPTVKPDLTKLVRAAEDALRGIVFHDDSQMCDQAVQKRYANPDRPAHVQIQVEQLGPLAETPR